MPLALTTVFADLPDPRIETANKLRPLTDILVIATRAVIAGADGWEDIAEYGRTKEKFFRRFLGLPDGVPSRDTFERVFAELGPDYIRNHRGIESGLHRALGVSFREGDGRTRAGHAAANLGMLRRVAVSLLKRTETKGSIQTRREKAGWDGDYLLQVRQGITAKDSA
jgi:hypothetical protein